MKLALHIGQQKTASTNIQQRLAELRPALMNHGVLYSSAFGRKNANRLKSTVRHPEEAGEQGRRDIERLRQEIEQDCPTLLLSRETLFGLDEDGIGAVARLLGRGRSISIHAYLRRPLDHIASYYQQKVGGFKAVTMDEFIAGAVESGYYLYKAKLDRWAAVFGREAIHARVFAPERWSSPVRNFLDWIGVDPAIDDAPRTSEERTRASLDPIAIELLRLTGRFHHDRPELLSEDAAFELRDAAHASNTGDRLRLGEQQADMLLAHCRADIEALAGSYLTADDMSFLLTAPSGGGDVAPPAAGAVIERAIELFSAMDARRPAHMPEQALREAVRAKPGGQPSSDADAVFGDLIDRLAALGFAFGPAVRSDLSEAAIERRREKLRRRRAAALDAVDEEIADDS